MNVKKNICIKAKIYDIFRAIDGKFCKTKRKMQCTVIFLDIV